MDKPILIGIIIAASVIFLGALGFAAYYLLNTGASCSLESPAACYSPEFGSNGMIIMIGNSGKQTLYMQDISISHDEECYFPKPELEDNPSYYYVDIPPGQVITFFTDINHPDGSCLMKGLEKGKMNSFRIELTYLEDGVAKKSKGSGRALYTDKIV